MRRHCQPIVSSEERTMIVSVVTSKLVLFAASHIRITYMHISPQPWLPYSKDPGATGVLTWTPRRSNCMGTCKAATPPPRPCIGPRTSRFVPRSSRTTAYTRDPILVQNKLHFPDIHFTRKVSNGAYGEVWLGDFNHERVAIKQIREDCEDDAHEIESSSLRSDSLFRCGIPMPCRALGARGIPKPCGCCVVAPLIPLCTTNCPPKRLPSCLARLWMSQPLTPPKPRKQPSTTPAMLLRRVWLAIATSLLVSCTCNCFEQYVRVLGCLMFLLNIYRRSEISEKYHFKTETSFEKEVVQLSNSDHLDFVLASKPSPMALYVKQVKRAVTAYWDAPIWPKKSKPKGELASVEQTIKCEPSHYVEDQDSTDVLVVGLLDCIETSAVKVAKRLKSTKILHKWYKETEWQYDRAAVPPSHNEIQDSIKSEKTSLKTTIEQFKASTKNHGRRGVRRQTKLSKLREQHYRAESRWEAFSVEEDNPLQSWLEYCSAYYANANTSDRCALFEAIVGRVAWLHVQGRNNGTAHIILSKITDESLKLAITNGIGIIVASLKVFYPSQCLVKFENLRPFDLVKTIASLTVTFQASLDVVGLDSSQNGLLIECLSRDPFQQESFDDLESWLPQITTVNVNRARETIASFWNAPILPDEKLKPKLKLKCDELFSDYLREAHLDASCNDDFFDVPDSKDFLIYALLYYIQTSAAKRAKTYTGKIDKAIKELHDWYKAEGAQFDDAVLPQSHNEEVRRMESERISLKSKMGQLKSEINRVKNRMNTEWRKDSDESDLKALEEDLASKKLNSDKMDDERESLCKRWLEDCSFNCDKAEDSDYWALLQSIVGRVAVGHVKNRNNIKAQISLSKIPDKSHRLVITNGVCILLELACKSLSAVEFESIDPNNFNDMDYFAEYIIKCTLGYFDSDVESE
ncbi:Aste57867_19643 [Aphanomyces stellatus]|uniref:Aste57867_19643 protein n=1 Tax=Aphanomyces stellatus TaxID=120398 RepID=A0A485LEL2_9STRA|nr:hypothetical protein As57867_019578 [Aphanomyces stellatus]VFT96343.1 Aste57867_19643 [Aphanomyces stellatus]